MPNLRNSLGIDFGTSYIGLAHSLEADNFIVKDYKTISRHEAIVKVVSILADLRIDLIVIGYPIDIYGKYTRVTGLVDGFIMSLAQHTDIEIVKQDEFGSSETAMQLIKDFKLAPKLIHQISAKIILSDYIHLKYVAK